MNFLIVKEPRLYIDDYGRLVVRDGQFEGASFEDIIEWAKTEAWARGLRTPEQLWEDTS